MSFIAVSKAKPCPLCNGNHACSFTKDGLRCCRRRHGEDVPGWIYLGETKNGTWGMYRQEGDIRGGFDPNPIRYRQRQTDLPLPQFVPVIPPKPPEDPDVKLRNWLAHPARDMVLLRGDSPQAKSWANLLGLPDPAIFEQLEVGWLQADDLNCGDLLAFPERDGQGAIVGYSCRYRDGRKKAIGRRGLCIPRALTPTSHIHEGAIYLVEGASDTLALLAMGRNAIGRPSNTGGGDYLIDFIRRLQKVRWWGIPEIVVVGENDRKADGRDLWPGRDGAYRIAHRLADELGIDVQIAFPPTGNKDVRDWFQKEMKRASRQSWKNPAPSVGGRWAYHILTSSSIVQPGQSNPYKGSSTFAQAAIVLATCVLSAGLPDISDLFTERDKPLADEARRRREEENAVAAAIKEAMGDFDRFPCFTTRLVAFLSKKTGNPFAIEFRCCQRNCAGCRLWLDWQELENAKLRFSQSERAGTTLTRFAFDDPKLWRALAEHLRRNDADYIKIVSSQDGGESFVVFASGTFLGSNRWQGTTVTPQQAIDEMKTLLPCYDGMKRPVSTSHEWKRPEADEKSGKFTRVGRINPTAIDKFFEIADTIDADVLPCVPARRNGTILRMWQFRRLAGWDYYTRDHLFFCLSCGEVLPYRQSAKADADEPPPPDFDPWDSRSPDCVFV